MKAIYLWHAKCGNSKFKLIGNAYRLICEKLQDKLIPHENCQNHLFAKICLVSLEYLATNVRYKVSKTKCFDIKIMRINVKER